MKDETSRFDTSTMPRYHHPCRGNPSSFRVASTSFLCPADQRESDSLVLKATRRSAPLLLAASAAAQDREGFLLNPRLLARADCRSPATYLDALSPALVAIRRVPSRSSCRSRTSAQQNSPS